MIRIYHTSDLHDHRGIVQPLRARRETAPGLLFDCGDSLRGSQTIYHAREPIVAEIDAAGYDAQAMGNREFHYLQRCVRARRAMMRHPLICGNLLDRRGGALPFARSLTLPYGNTRVHLAAVIVTQYPQGSAWERVFGWRFLDPIEAVREAAAAVPDGEPFVLLSHVGLRADRRIAAAVPRIDLLLGGHSHDTLHEPEHVNGVPIVHAGPYGRHVSRSELEYDADARRWRIERFALEPLLHA